jgi:DNA ligase-1
MKDFAALYWRLDAATSTKRKHEAIVDFLRGALADPDRRASAAWTVYLLAGGKPRQLVSTRLLRDLALEEAGLPEWLLEECYHSVGDLAETLALLLPAPTTEENVALDAWVNDRLARVKNLDENSRLARLATWTRALAAEQRLPFFKLITGALRVGVSKLTVVRALSEATGVDATHMAQRMMGFTQATRALTAGDFITLTRPAGDNDSEPQGHPYPFFLAHAQQIPTQELSALLGPVSDWFAEWKYDGIRAQLIARGGVWRLWSRGEELVNDSFPEMGHLARFMPDGTVLDGELLVLDARKSGENPSPLETHDIRPFTHLQQRLGRKIVSAKILKELPVGLVAYDILEARATDVRHLPQSERRVLLERVVQETRANAAVWGEPTPLHLSPLIERPDWLALDTLREEARTFGAEGMMLKARSAPYGVGRRKSAENGRGGWWKWKLDPMSVDAVLIYAQRGSGRRSGVFSDYTFAVWSGTPEDEDRALVPFAKAYSGLSDDEMRQVDSIVRKTTVESFGPVRRLRPTMVFELGFEGIGSSKRHKSGIAVRFPRMLKWRLDKPVEEADTLVDLRKLLPTD